MGFGLFLSWQRIYSDPGFTPGFTPGLVPIQNLTQSRSVAKKHRTP